MQCPKEFNGFIQYSLINAPSLVIVPAKMAKVHQDWLILFITKILSEECQLYARNNGSAVLHGNFDIMLHFLKFLNKTVQDCCMYGSE